MSLVPKLCRILVNLTDPQPNFHVPYFTDRGFMQNTGGRGRGEEKGRGEDSVGWIPLWAVMASTTTLHLYVSIGWSTLYPPFCFPLIVNYAFLRYHTVSYIFFAQSFGFHHTFVSGNFSEVWSGSAARASSNIGHNSATTGTALSYIIFHIVTYFVVIIARYKCYYNHFIASSHIVCQIKTHLLLFTFLLQNHWIKNTSSAIFFSTLGSSNS